MKKHIDTNRISKMIKESASVSTNRSNINLIETKRVGNTTFGLIKEFNTYIVKSTKKTSDLITEDFNYIGGEQNRQRFMRSNLAEAKRFFNFYLSEQQRNPLLKEEDDKYVIKKEVDMPEPETNPDVDMDIDADELDVSDDEAPEVEADMEEYQELTGKLAYILRQLEEDKKDDVTKYVFNSLIAAFPQVSDEVSSSIKEKMEAKLNGDESSDDETENMESDADTGLEENLKRKGFIVSEKFTKEQALAFFGAKDKSGIFVQKPTRFYDGETKEPHMNKGVNKIGKSTPFENNPSSTSKDHPYKDEKGKKKAPKKKVNENTDEPIKRKRARKKLPIGTDKLAMYKKMQIEGQHERLANIFLTNALRYHGGPLALRDVSESKNYTFAFSYLKSASRRKESITKLYIEASKLAKKLIKEVGLEIIKEEIEESFDGHSLRSVVADRVEKGAVHNLERIVINNHGRSALTPEVENEIKRQAAKLEKYTFGDKTDITSGHFIQRALKAYDNHIKPLIMKNESGSLWQDVEESMEIGGELPPSLEDREEQKRDEWRDEKNKPEHQELLKYYDDKFGDASIKNPKAPDVSIEDMLKDEYLDV